MANYAERFLLLQAMIVRRVPFNSTIGFTLLLEALEEDYKLVKDRCPEFYFNDNAMRNLRQEVDICVKEDLIGDSLRRKIGRADQAVALRRTEHGDRLLSSLEPWLEEALDSMPMSDVGVLDFLSQL